MEYIRVKLSKGVPGETVSVLIDGETNGMTESVIEVEDGDIEITADYPGAETKLVTVDYASSTPEVPKEVVINVA